MPALNHLDLLTIDDYLLGEAESEVRHEYVGGAVFAMAGPSAEHNAIAGNIFAALHAHLRGKTCRAFIADFKVRLQVAGDDLFYYPDVMVACDPLDTDRYFKRYPKVLFEVLSPETERIDRREKFLSYTQIETLEEYVLVAQNKMEMTVFRRANNWLPEVLRQSEQSMRLTSIEVNLPLNLIYEGVKVGG